MTIDIYNVTLVVLPGTLVKMLSALVRYWLFSLVLPDCFFHLVCIGMGFLSLYKRKKQSGNARLLVVHDFICFD